jgi:hypothetical protein
MHFFMAHQAEGPGQGTARRRHTPFLLCSRAKLNSVHLFYKLRFHLLSCDSVAAGRRLAAGPNAKARFLWRQQRCARWPPAAARRRPDGCRGVGGCPTGMHPVSRNSCRSASLGSRAGGDNLK